jgi:plasmid maintenance system antidote protein VapI
METTGERLRYYIENQYGAIKEFCQKFEIHYPGLTSIMNNKRPLGMEVLHQIKKALPNLDTEWLLYGTKRLEITNIANELPIASEPLEVYGIADPGEIALLKYLDRPNVQEKLRLIITNQPK